MYLESSQGGKSEPAHSLPCCKEGCSGKGKAKRGETVEETELRNRRINQQEISPRIWCPLAARQECRGGRKLLKRNNTDPIKMQCSLWCRNGEKD